MQTPVLETVAQRNLRAELKRPKRNEVISGNTQSISLLLHVSGRQGPVTCIIIVKDDDHNAVYENFRRILGHASTYDLIRACPLHLVNILCGQLEDLNEKYWRRHQRQYEGIEDSMLRFCRRQKMLYKDHGMSVFWTMHKLNTLHRALVPLDYVTAFEMSALKFARDTMSAYRDSAGGAPPSPARLEQFHQESRYLETAAKFRQASRRRINKLAEISVGIVSDSYFQPIALLDFFVRKGRH